VDSPSATWIEHEPATYGLRGQTQSITASVRGYVHPDAVLLVYFLGQGGRSYAHVRMMPTGGAQFVGVVPAGAARGLALHYYFELSTASGSPIARLGWPEDPVRLSLQDPVAKPAGLQLSTDWWMCFGACATVPFFILLVLRLRRNAALDREFWLAALLPALRSSGSERTLEVTRLAGRPIEHPLHGVRRYSRSQIHRKLEKVQRYHREKLQDGVTTEMPMFDVRSGEFRAISARQRSTKATQKRRRERELVGAGSDRSR
jgi:hypothetical protein